MTSVAPADHVAADRHGILVIGCGNSLRGDDGAGPECVRRLAARGLPPGTAAVDAGTAGADVVLRMREAERVILVDCCASGLPAGSLVPLSAAEIAALPSSDRLDIHAFRWSDAVALVRSLSPGGGPAVSARLVEGLAFEPGSGLSPAVDGAVERLAEALHAELVTAAGAAEG